MEIRLAWDFDLYSYKTLFPEIKLFDWERDYRKEIDLVVFPGGEDVSLEYYSSRGEIETYKELCYTSKTRDSSETQVLDACYSGSGKIRVNKILGVCRGMQFINVMFDGKLYQDLPSVGLGHSRIHSLEHEVPSNLEFLTVVNSMHHQSIRTLGEFNRAGNKIKGTIIATHKGIPEIVTWDKERVLGVQFHPEYFSDDFDGKVQFREFCYSWVNGNTKILK